jgi:IS30 family transposase
MCAVRRSRAMFTMTETSFARAVCLKDIKERIKDMKYRSFYAHWAMDEVEKGNIVYVLDRQTRTVETFNELTVGKATAVLKSAEEDSKRYEFWVEEEENKDG